MMYRTTAALLITLVAGLCATPLLAQQAPQRFHVPSQEPLQPVQQLVAQQIAAQPTASSSSVVEPATYERDLVGRRGLGGSVVTVVSSLAIVLGLFAGLIWVLRRTGMAKVTESNGGRMVEVIDRVPFTGSQQLQVIRFGQRIILVATSMGNATPVGEMSLSEFQSQQGRTPAPSRQSFEVGRSETSRTETGRSEIDQRLESGRERYDRPALGSVEQNIRPSSI